MKTPTVKDVLYALQFGGQRLETFPDPRRGVGFRLMPAGTRIPNNIAEQARSLHAKETRNAQG